MSRIGPALAAVAVALGAAAVSALPAHAAPADTSAMATVSVVHGIPNTPVNVFVNGKDTLPNFTPGTVAGPLQLPAGSYMIKVFPATNTKGTGTPVIQATAALTGGENVSLVAHLTAAGKPTLTPFVNDTSMLGPGKGRLVVRHTAAAPAVDVRANGKVAFSNLTNPHQASADLPVGTIKADVVLAGTSTVAIGPADVSVRAGTETIVYAIGSAQAKTLSLVVQTIGGLGTIPSRVPAGVGDVPAQPVLPVWVLVLAGVGSLLAVGAVLGRVRLARAKH